MYFIDQTTSDAALLEKYAERGPAMLEARNLYPMWAIVAYALAVWGGLLASILLLMRKSISVSLFVISLIAAIICFVPMFTIPAMKVAGGDMFWLMPAIVIVLGLFEVWWSTQQKSKGTIR